MSEDELAPDEYILFVARTERRKARLHLRGYTAAVREELGLPAQKATPVDFQDAMVLATQGLNDTVSKIRKNLATLTAVGA